MKGTSARTSSTRRYMDGAGSFAQAAARHSTCTLATDPVRRGRSVSTRSPKPPIVLGHLQPLPAVLGEGHRVQAARNDEPIPFNRVGDAGRIGRDRAQVAEGFPSLRLAAGRLIEFAHDANRSLLDRANFWRASSASLALRCCALWHRRYQA